MIKYLGLFVIICTISISTPGIINAHAATQFDYDMWVVCMVLYSPFGDFVCGPEPYVDPPIPCKDVGYDPLGNKVCYDP